MTDIQIGLGDLDGEIPANAQLKVSGAGSIDRALLRGERVVITVIGEVTGISFKQEKGVLTRIHTVKAETMAEPYDSLAEDVTQFLAEIEDRREGKNPLPFDNEEGSDPDEEGDG